MSNVDTLLDFDSPAEKGPSQAGNGPSIDPFDPFGPTPTLDSKGGNGLLLDFDTTVQNGASTENGGDNVNLLYEFESGNRNDLFNLGEEEDSVRTEDLAALIKQQTDDDQIVVRETVTTDEDGQTTIVTTRRSRSYDSDRELSPEVEQIIEESMTTSDDGMVTKKVIKTTTMQSEYLDDSAEFSDQNRFEDQSDQNRFEDQSDQNRFEDQSDQNRFEDQSLETESFEERSYEEQPSVEEQSYEGREEVSFDDRPSVEDESYEERPSVQDQSYEERPSVDQSYEERPSVEAQLYDAGSQEGSLVEVSYEERSSYDDNPSFTEQQTEEIDAHKRRSMSPSPSSSDDEQGQLIEDPHKRRSMSPSPAEIQTRSEQKETDDQVGADNDYQTLDLHVKKRSNSGSMTSLGRLISDEHLYEVFNFNTAPVSERRYKSPYENLNLNATPGNNQRSRFGSTKEEEIIKNGATFYRSNDNQNASEQKKSNEIGDEQEETQTMVKEELAPGQLKSPFFGDAPKPENGVEDSDVERDPNIAREVRNREQIKFAELTNFKNKFETGVESKKVSTITTHELDRVRQSSGAGSLKNKFENVGKEETNQERKGVREITPPQADAKIVYEKEPVRDPNVIRSEDTVDEGIYMPKPGSSKGIRDKFNSGNIQESAPRQRSSVIDEIQQVEGGVFENEPQINPDVVRSGEGDTFADLPASGSARSALSKFKQMESSAGYVPAPRGVREITPPSGGKVEYVSEPTAHVEKYEGKAESGVFESQPQHRPDVVRSGEPPQEDTDQLPQQGFTKSAAALFRQKETEAARVKTASSGGLRQLTPPRDQPVVYENEPQRLPDVVRSEDKKEEVDLPQSGAARNMLAKFRQWESTGGPNSQVQRQPKAFTPPREGEGGVYENTPEKFVPDYGNRSEGGVYENQPQHRDDVVRSEDRAGEELPGQGAAKNMVAKFRQISESTKSQSPISPRSPHDRSFKEFTPPREDPRTPGVQPADMPDQYQQGSGGVSENQPQLREDVVREADTNYEAGMPAPSTTKNLLARFKAIQQDVKTKEEPKAVRKESPQLYNRPSPSSNTPNSKEGVSRFRAVQPEKCASCQKTVYAMEKMEFNKNVYHKTCFKCSHCKNRLTPATFSVNQGILYCLNHFKQMFKTKGNYDEGFGREQYKKKWKSEPNLAGLSDDDHAGSRS